MQAAIGRTIVIYAIVSADDGASWSDEIVIRGDLPNGNLGYPGLSSGRFVTWTTWWH